MSPEARAGARSRSDLDARLRGSAATHEVLTLAHRQDVWVWHPRRGRNDVLGCRLDEPVTSETKSGWTAAAPAATTHHGLLPLKWDYGGCQGRRSYGAVVEGPSGRMTSKPHERSQEGLPTIASCDKFLARLEPLPTSARSQPWQGGSEVRLRR